MLRRVATLLLTAAVAYAGLTACPRGGVCCLTQVSQSQHDCCAATASLRTPDCCRDNGKTFTPRALSAQPSGPGVHDAVAALPAAVVSIDSSVATRAVWGVTAKHGLAPPGSLTALHTSLLL